MKLDFICITQLAVRAIIQSRKHQSLDYEDSVFIVNIANGIFDNSIEFDLPIVFKFNNKGLVVSHEMDKYESERNSITLDFKQLSFEDLSDNLKVTCIQKLLRFCVKYWENLGHSSSEIIPLDSTKGIIFPNNSQFSQYRIVTELAPFKSKANKVKKYKGKHILAYKFGKNSGAKNKEECEVNVLKKALDVLFSVDTYSKINNDVKSSGQSSYGGIDLSQDDLLNTTNLLGRDNPIELLSDMQKKFINADWCHPARINGPAGSGKTICLVLKALKVVNESESKINVLFIVPSTSVRNTVEYFLKVSASSSGILSGQLLSKIKVRTIQQVCIELLGQDISSSELLDEDNYEAKQTQLLYVMEIVEDLKHSISKQKVILSESFYNFFSCEDSLAISELLIHEFGVVIKGRCGSVREEYVKSESVLYSLPTYSENDKYFVFNIFDKYQGKLDELAQFDPDDIALSAMGRLDSPLWKRRRGMEGYDLIIADELHLLNFNELCLIHFLTKSTKSAPISFAVDATQAIGDIAWKNESVLEYLNIKEFSREEEVTDLTAVFRCSESVTRLASSITSSGASLFTNFIDPLAHSTDVQLGLDEYMPEYRLIDSQGISIHQYALDMADRIKDEINCFKHKIVLIYFDRLLFEEAKDEFITANKSISCLVERGDIELVERAKNKNDYIVAMADYVGGLEFEAVILVGVDKGRLPREERASSNASQLFQSYTAHNRLYVAITRASKIVNIIGELRRGVSPIIQTAIDQKLISLM